jgi:hypothetical protein
LPFTSPVETIGRSAPAGDNPRRPAMVAMLSSALESFEESGEIADEGTGLDG